MGAALASRRQRGPPPRADRQRLLGSRTTASARSRPRSRRRTSSARRCADIEHRGPRSSSPPEDRRALRPARSSTARARSATAASSTTPRDPYGERLAQQGAAADRVHALRAGDAAERAARVLQEPRRRRVRRRVHDRLRSTASPSSPKQCPAVVHVDGTARPQLVDEHGNPGFHAILAEYEAPDRASPRSSTRASTSTRSRSSARRTTRCGPSRRRASTTWRWVRTWSTRPNAGAPT